jgi:hypothetical protein
MYPGIIWIQVFDGFHIVKKIHESVIRPEKESIERVGHPEVRAQDIME